MTAYLWLFVFVGYIVMTVVFVAVCVLYILSLPVTLRVTVPSDGGRKDDAEAGGEAGEQEDGQRRPRVAGRAE